MLKNTNHPLAYASMQPLARSASSAGVFWLALLTTIATFPLICMGGLVTSHHAGMSVPDWPNSYGYNMFLFPPSKWVGGILYEHTHRLMGTVVGMLSMALAGWAWRAQIINLLPSDSANRDIAPVPNEPHRYLALLVLGGVIFQGVLGGLRVVWVKLDLAIIHACVAQAFFCLAALMTCVSSRWWNEPRDQGVVSRGRGLMWLGVVTVAAVYLQLIIGAIMRHFDAGLAIADLPLAYGRWLPPMTADDLAAANHLRAFQLNLDPVTMSQIWLHFAHRVGAVTVSILVITFALKALFSPIARRFAFLAISLLVLLVTQVTLGVLTVLLRKPADVASAHVAVGALVLVTSFVMMLRAARFSRASHRRPVSSSAANLTPSPLYTGERAGVRGLA